MHDTWNPWHGCKKISEGCANCYMYFLDQMRAQDGSLIRLTNNMKKPLAKNRKGEYKIKSGELIRVCMTSDFFLEEADAWRTQAWDIMRIRSDVKFFLLSKRPERILSCLPSDWGRWMGKHIKSHPKPFNLNKPSAPVYNTKEENTNIYSSTNLITTYQRNRDTNANLISTVQNVVLNSYAMELN